MVERSFIQDFSLLGKQIIAWLNDAETCPVLSCAAQQSVSTNSWFTESNIRQSLSAIATAFLSEQKLQAWLSQYIIAPKPKRIGVVMAGNIPLVGFHDFLCVLASRHYFVGKLSHKDKFLLPVLVEMLCAINPEWRNRITFVEEIDVTKIDAFIVTGSDTTADFFSRLSASLPPSGRQSGALIRHNRRSVAILTGNETHDDLQGLAVDMFSYFGMGCRNVSMLYVPKGYDWKGLLNIFSAQQPFKRLEPLKSLLQHAGYAHNYRYQKALLTLQAQPFIDAGVALLYENENLQAPPAVAHFCYYEKIAEMLECLEQQCEQIQCVVGNTVISNKFCTFGTAQQPQLDDYADGVDTMQWLADC